MTIAVGQMAPDFTMPTNGGGTVSLAGLKGRKVVLYFYPRDDTSGCTTQACGFNDALPDFTGADAVVIGVSKDSVASHDKFAQKFGLNFVLASDEKTDVTERYGMWVEKSMYGKKYMGIERSTVLIDGEGVIRHIWRKVKPASHPAEVLAAVKTL
ncbi:MAG TPA: thioredoxin-dependent thiol peroxidase [Azospirillaceae bacterium]|nr:thioredoxin-dependent thiol peroxidase [Azospirillaceae bacterium]